MAKIQILSLAGHNLTPHHYDLAEEGREAAEFRVPLIHYRGERIGATTDYKSGFT